jgi:hypothetical protein
VVGERGAGGGGIRAGVALGTAAAMLALGLASGLSLGAAAGVVWARWVESAGRPAAAPAWSETDLVPAPPGALASDGCATGDRPAGRDATQW